MILKTENEWKILPEELIQRADNIVKEKQHMWERSPCVNVSVTTPIFTLYSATWTLYL